MDIAAESVKRQKGSFSDRLDVGFRSSIGLKKNPASNGIDNKLVADASSVLSEEIKFVPARKSSSLMQNNLKSKYTLIRAPNTALHNGNFSSISSNGVSQYHLYAKLPGNTSSWHNGRPAIGHNIIENRDQQASAAGVDSLPSPQRVLFVEDRVNLQWSQRRGIGVGLKNQGNTCFMNSILQALTYTPPLFNFLQVDHNRDSCKTVKTGICSLCELGAHVRTVLQPTRTGPVAPTNIIRNMKLIMKSYQFGRQEDAHEFLRYFIDSMQNSLLFPLRQTKLELYTKCTSAIYRIFGGFHRNEIICTTCYSQSMTYDPFLDLSLEIKGDSLAKCLQHFTRTETLQFENAYQCAKCKRKTSAKKSYTIHKEPNVLTIQLKRFTSHFGKATQFVDYPDNFDLRPFMSVKQGPTIPYRLFAVVVHVGATMNSGHYFCYARAPNEVWHRLDDSTVAQVGLTQVMKAQAYLLFYCRVAQTNSSAGFERRLTPQQTNQNMGVRNGTTPESLAKTALAKGSVAPPEQRQFGPYLPPRPPLSSPSFVSSSSARPTTTVVFTRTSASAPVPARFVVRATSSTAPAVSTLTAVTSLIETKNVYGAQQNGSRLYACFSSSSPVAREKQPIQCSTVSTTRLVAYDDDESSDAASTPPEQRAITPEGGTQRELTTLYDSPLAKQPATEQREGLKKAPPGVVKLIPVIVRKKLASQQTVTPKDATVSSSSPLVSSTSGVISVAQEKQTNGVREPSAAAPETPTKEPREGKTNGHQTNGNGVKTGSRQDEAENGERRKHKRHYRHRQSSASSSDDNDAAEKKKKRHLSEESPPDERLKAVSDDDFTQNACDRPSRHRYGQDYHSHRHAEERSYEGRHWRRHSEHELSSNSSRHSSRGGDDEYERRHRRHRHKKRRHHGGEYETSDGVPDERQRESSSHWGGGVEQRVSGYDDFAPKKKKSSSSRGDHCYSSQ